MKRKNKRVLVMSSIGIVALIVLFLVTKLFQQKQVGHQVEDIQIKHLVGNTVEERLEARHIDTTQAVITKIEDVDALQSRYSALFRDAQSGQHIVELPDRIFVYDFEHDEIISEFMFQKIDLGERQS